MTVEYIVDTTVMSIYMKKKNIINELFLNKNQDGLIKNRHDNRGCVRFNLRGMSECTAG